ncbi:MAG: squalene synthase HpnC [Planctomycetaceae bacterium]|nr:squalene synthase HpnC [Planctomycetaceae bacterium]MCB9950587.1 squalene synthase HpnC [Planctomycetaceae bacterium]
MSVRDDLARFGPQQAETVSSGDAQAYCANLGRTHYENFPVVSWLLPRHLHQHFFNVYAFCRWADDLGDEMGDREESLRLLNWWEEEVEACYQGEVRHPVFVALTESIQQFSLPKQLFLDLISAFRQDQTVAEYQTFEQLRDYCRRSADPVGRLVLYLCSSFTEERGLLSDSVCTGLQLANFWQDVARDADIGRTYLPREDRIRFGYSDLDLKDRKTTPEFRELLKFEVDRARELLIAGLPLVPQMPGRLQVDIDLFIQGGLQILKGIERIDYDVWSVRPKVSKVNLALAAVGSLFKMWGRLIFMPRIIK